MSVAGVLPAWMQRDVIDRERKKAHEDLSELYNTFLWCHFPVQEDFMVEPLAHLCAPVPAGLTEGTPNSQSVEISPALVVSIRTGSRDGDIPILIWGQKNSEPGTEARALSDLRRARFPSQLHSLLRNIEGLLPVPMVIVEENRVCAYPATEIQLCTPVEYPSTRWIQAYMSG